MKYIPTIRDNQKQSVLILLIFLLFCACAATPVRFDESKETLPSYYAEIAQQHYNNKKFLSAIRVYEQLIKRFADKKDLYEKDLAWAHYEIGFCYLVRKQNKSALNFFNSVLKNFDTLAPRTLAQQRIDEIGKKKARAARTKGQEN